MDMLEPRANLGSHSISDDSVAKDLEDWALVPAPMPDEPIPDASPLKALLQYHILPFPLQPSNIKDGMLVGTERRSSGLKGERQRLRVDVSERLDPTDWDTIGNGEIRFGGSTVLGKPGESKTFVRSSQPG